jgi:hypothetical protein
MVKTTLVLASIVSFANHALAQTPETRPAGGLVCLACSKGPDAPFPVRRTVLSQRLDAFDPWIAHMAGQPAIVLQTRRTTLVVAVQPGPVDALTDDELAHLRAVFPKLAAGVPGTLDAHQQAHVIGLRVRRVEDDLAAVLALDADGRVKPQPGHAPLASDHVEVFVFGAKPAYESFTAFLFEREAWPAGGAMFDWGPTSAILVPSLKDPAARRQLAFTTSMQLLRGLSRAGAGLQGWLRVGISHVMEDRHAAKGPRAAPDATLPPGSEAPKDWDAFVGDLVTGGKAGDLGGLAATPVHALTVRSRLQSWSLVRWLLAKDSPRFADMVRRILHAPPSDSAQKALLDAVRPAFGLDLVTLNDEWKASVQKGKAATK